MSFKVAPKALWKIFRQDKNAGAALVQAKYDVVRNWKSNLEISLMNTKLERTFSSLCLTFQFLNQLIHDPFFVSRAVGHKGVKEVSVTKVLGLTSKPILGKSVSKAPDLIAANVEQHNGKS